MNETGRGETVRNPKNLLHQNTASTNREGQVGKIQQSSERHKVNLSPNGKKDTMLLVSHETRPKDIPCRDGALLSHTLSH